MENSYLKRINELAKKAKSEGLSEEEIEERDILRKRYIAEFRRSFQNILDNTKIEYPDGSSEKLSDYRKPTDKQHRSTK